MTETTPPNPEPRADTGADTDFATASPQQREAIVERLCEAVLSETNGPRVGEPVG